MKNQNLTLDTMKELIGKRVLYADFTLGGIREYFEAKLLEISPGKEYARVHFPSNVGPFREQWLMRKRLEDWTYIEELPNRE